MDECKMKNGKLTRQMNGMITITFRKVTLFLFLKNEMHLFKALRVRFASASCTHP